MAWTKDKVFMSHRGKRIWYAKDTETGDVLYMVAKGDGTDEYFLNWRDAMNYIDEVKDAKSAK